MITKGLRAQNLTIGARVADKLGRTGVVTEIISPKRVAVRFTGVGSYVMYRTSLRYAA